MSARTFYRDVMHNVIRLYDRAEPKVWKVVRPLLYDPKASSHAPACTDKYTNCLATNCWCDTGIHNSENVNLTQLHLAYLAYQYMHLGFQLSNTLHDLYQDYLLETERLHI